MMDRYRDHSNAAAFAVVATLVVAGIVSWATFFVVFVSML